MHQKIEKDKSILCVRGGAPERMPCEAKEARTSGVSEGNPKVANIGIVEAQSLKPDRQNVTYPQVPRSGMQLCRV